MHIESVEVVSTPDGIRVFVLAAGNNQLEECHACPGLIGAFMLEAQADQYRLVASSKEIYFGSWGNVSGSYTGSPEPYFRFQQFGPRYFGWLLWSSYIAQGEKSSVYSILTQSKSHSAMEFVGAIPKDFDSTGTFSCDQKQPKDPREPPAFCTSLIYDLTILTSNQANYLYPIYVKEVEVLNGVSGKSKTYQINFDEKKWAYSLPFEMPWMR